MSEKTEVTARGTVIVREDRVKEERGDRESLPPFNLEHDLRLFGPRDLLSESQTQVFFGHGKILLSGEYFILDGALGLGLPTQVGQKFVVKYSPSFKPTLYWKSYDVRGNLWLEARFEFWRFECLDEHPTPEVLMLQKVLRQVRKQNSHFLRDEVDVHVESYLGFPRDWGLGSSSTFIYNMAQWGYVAPFELLFKTYGGSGYDIACAQSAGPILYRKEGEAVHWNPTIFSPTFSDNLYFVYQGQKKSSRHAINDYQKKVGQLSDERRKEIVSTIGLITEQMVGAKTLSEFENLMEKHEELISSSLELPMVKSQKFSDYWGKIKSLGAWGGDFILATSERPQQEVENYFKQKGLSVIIPYKKLILDSKFSAHHLEEAHEHIH